MDACAITGSYAKLADWRGAVAEPAGARPADGGAAYERSMLPSMPLASRCECMGPGALGAMGPTFMAFAPEFKSKGARRA